MDVVENVSQPYDITNDDLDLKTLEDLDCPIYTNNSGDWIEYTNFWVSGVTSTCIAIPGFIGKCPIFL